MSGLAVLLGNRADPGPLEAMLKSAPHRGSVKAVHSGPGWALGIQAAPTESPFVSSGMWLGKDIAVAVTGCLYRHESIIVKDQAAQRLGETYQQGGPAALAGLRGSFAAVVLGTSSNAGLAIRSAVGERPLFWRAEGGNYAFASEVKQLLASPMTLPPKDPEGVMAVLGSGEAGGATCFSGIHRLAAGSWISTDNAVTVHRFWDRKEAVGGAKLTLQEALEEFRTLLRIAVIRRLSPGAGVLLSGGLDSSAVAAEAAKAHQGLYGFPLKFVSATYPELPKVDESRFIRVTAEGLGCEVIWVRPKPKLFSDLDWEIWLQDGPDAAPMSANVRWIYRAACAEGVTVCLDGHDGDALLGTFEGLAHALLRRGKLGHMRRLVDFAARANGVSRRTALRQIVVPGVVDFVPPARTLWRKLRRDKAPPGWIPSWTAGSLRTRLGATGGPTDWSQAEWLSASATVPQALEVLERIALSQGISVVHPLADPDLVDFLLSLPPEIKFAGGRPKALIRLGYPELPHEVVNRKDKTYFGPAAAAGSPPSDLLRAVLDSPRKLPDVDWSSLEHSITNGIPASQLRALRFVITADRFLAGHDS